MAMLDLTTLSVPTPAVYDEDFPTKEQENLAYVNLQIWEKAQANGYILDDGQITAEEQSTWEAMWTAQNSILEKQSAYVDEVKDLFSKKQKELPQEDSILDDLLDDLKELLIDWSITKLLTVLGITAGGWATAIAMGVRLTIGYLFKEFKKILIEGQIHLNAIKSENTAITELTMTRQNYQLRSQIITQHDIAIGNLITHVNALESRVQQTIVETDWKEMSENLKNTSEKIEELQGKVEDLQYNDEEIDLNGVRIALRSKAISVG